MSASRIANRYAKPLFDLAQERKSLDAVMADMTTFNELCKTNRDFDNFLKSPIIPDLRKDEILRKIFSGKLHDLTFSMFSLLTRKHRSDVLSTVASEFIKVYHRRMGYQEATVTTTFKLDEKTRKSFQKVVEDISGRKAVLKERTNPEIIGGYLLTLDDRQIDESVNGKLKQIRLNFSKEKNK
jgi:F-type H+-transporting ATPase subunit delta